MLLADWEIALAIAEGRLLVTPMIDAGKQIGSSSIDLRLGTEFRVIRRLMRSHFDVKQSRDDIEREVREYTEVVHLSANSPFILHPGEFALATTLEYIKIPSDLAGRLEGRSTWGRVGLQIHSTAGFVDPGFEGTLTFELHNMGKLPLPLYAGVRISQLSLHRCGGAIEPYVSRPDAKYARSTGARNTMFYQDYEYDVIRSFDQCASDDSSVPVE